MKSFIIFLNNYNHQIYKSIEVFFKPYAMQSEIEIFGFDVFPKKDSQNYSEIISTIDNLLHNISTENRFIFVYTKKEKISSKPSEEDLVWEYTYTRLIDSIKQLFSQYEQYQTSLVILDMLERDRNGEYKNIYAKVALEIDKNNLIPPRPEYRKFYSLNLSGSEIVQKKLNNFTLIVLRASESYRFYLILISFILLLCNDSRNQLPKEEWYEIETIELNIQKFLFFKNEIDKLKVPDLGQVQQNVNLYTKDIKIPWQITLDEINTISENMYSREIDGQISLLKKNNIKLQNIESDNDLILTKQKNTLSPSDIEKRIEENCEKKLEPFLDISEELRKIDIYIKKLQDKLQAVYDAKREGQNIMSSLSVFLFFIIVLVSVFLFNSSEDTIVDFIINNYIGYFIFFIVIVYVYIFYLRRRRQKKSIQRIQETFQHNNNQQIDIQKKIKLQIENRIMKKINEKNLKILLDIDKKIKEQKNKFLYYQRTIEMIKQNVVNALRNIDIAPNQNNNIQNITGNAVDDIEIDKPLWEQNCFRQIYEHKVLKHEIIVNIQGQIIKIKSPSFLKNDIECISIVRK